ncbi:hypothetical protein ACWEOW_23865, partial [Monashia sp. NPDC004114]
HEQEDEGAVRAVLRWRTAAGRTYLTHPKDWLEGHRPTDPHPDPEPDPTTPLGPPDGQSPGQSPGLAPATHDPPPF